MKQPPSFATTLSAPAASSSHLTQRATLFASALLTLLPLLVPTAAMAGKNLNPGLYAQNYQMVVSANSAWLEHPTGQYVDMSNPKNAKRHWYEPEHRETSDIDATATELSAQGYVMVGFAAFNTSQASGGLYDDPTFQSMSPSSQRAYILGLKMRGRFQQASNPMGDARDAARWANAAMVVVQRDFAFERAATQAHRIVASEDHQQVRNFGQVSSTRTERMSSARPSSGRLGRNTSSYTATTHERYDDTVQQQGRQWSTVLLEETESHYDYVATFWKKADPHKVTLGLVTEAVPGALRPVLGTRHGRLITAVIGGTPAWDADLWEGDVLLAMDGRRVTTAEVYNELLTELRGRDTVVTIWRNGELYDFPVRMNG